MNKWVQHLSGQGEKWEIAPLGLRDTCSFFMVWQDATHTFHYHLPKSEFRECDPPERWVDVTVDIEQGSTGSWSESEASRYAVRAFEPYRLRKVMVTEYGWAFIVEKKES